ncbi:MAG TPA: hypothetical protein GX743_07430, partial [Actinomycetales bacterium]|nr:hypothetical protein [Actinomycetales bacterium]
MQTLHEVATLARGTASLWWARLPAIGLWLCLGFVGRELAIMASVRFGPNLLGSTLAFVAAMVVWVVCLVMMLHEATRGRQAYRFDEATGRVAPADPSEGGRSPQDVLTHAVVPFLAAWAAWGFTEDHVQRVFNANIIHYGIDATNYSITFAAWPTYLAIAVVAWVVQAVLEITMRGRGGIALGLVRVFVRGMVILTAFLGLDSLITRSVDWARGRAFWAWGRDTWEAFKGLLPDWKLWWDTTIPEAVQQLVDALWGYLIPGLWLVVALPLVWLALTATVVGWDDLHRALPAGRLLGRVTSTAARVRRLRPVRSLEAAPARSPIRLLVLWLQNQVEDLVPVLQAFRLILRSGWPFIAAYLLLGAVVQAISTVVIEGLLHMVGPQDFASTMRYLQLLELAGEFLMWTIA